MSKPIPFGTGRRQQQDGRAARAKRVAAGQGLDLGGRQAEPAVPSRYQATRLYPAICVPARPEAVEFASADRVPLFAGRTTATTASREDEHPDLAHISAQLADLIDLWVPKICAILANDAARAVTPPDPEMIQAGLRMLAKGQDHAGRSAYQPHPCGQCPSVSSSGPDSQYTDM